MNAKKFKRKFKKKAKQAAGPLFATGAGASIGCWAVAASGMTAVGMVGGGAGVGSAAGPVGVAVGAMGGLATYGLVRAVVDLVEPDNDEKTEN
jgi:hypothetical protein